MRFAPPLHLTIVAVILFFMASALAAQPVEKQTLCERSSRVRTVSLTYGQFRLTVTAPRNDTESCSFQVVSPAGDVLVHDEYADYIPQPEYVDLDGDGSAELVVVSGSNGSGGYADSYVFSQAPQVRLIQAIREACPVEVQDGPTGWAIVTCDLEFASFDGLCNACSPRPAVYLRLEQGRLRDRSSVFAREYDSHIAEVRKQLKDGDVPAFLKSRTPDDAAYEGSNARPSVLSIILDYLYSGREPQARQVLQTMWPAWDRERVWDDIVNTRSVGVLEQVQ
jgi:hypothetical protein